MTKIEKRKKGKKEKKEKHRPKAGEQEPITISKTSAKATEITTNRRHYLTKILVCIYYSKL